MGVVEPMGVVKRDPVHEMRILSVTFFPFFAFLAVLLSLEMVL